jgi:hypothetical protein
MGDSSNVSYYDFKDLKLIVSRLCRNVKCLQANDEFGLTLLSPPVLAPTGDEPVVLVNITTQEIWGWDGDSWEVLGGSGGFFFSDVASAITLQNANNNDFTLEGVNHLSIDSTTAILQGTDYIQLQTSSAGNAILLEDSTGIRLSSEADIRLGSTTSQYNFLMPNGTLALPTEDNAVLSVLGLNTTTGRVYRRTVASIGGGADTNFAANNLTFTGNRTHTGSNIYGVTIGNMVNVNINTGAGNQSITMDNSGDGIQLVSDSTVNSYVDLGGGVTGGLSVSGGIVSIHADAGVEANSINLLPGILGLQFRDSQGYYNFDATGGSLLPSLDDIGEPFEGFSNNMLTVDTDGRILRKALPTASDNIATADLTFSNGDRAHDLNTSSLQFTNGSVFKVNTTSNIEAKVVAGGGETAEFNAGVGYSYINSTDGAENASVLADATGGGIVLTSTSGIYSIAGLPTYADDTAAGAGGLVAGRIYKTSTGVMMVKL